MTAAYTTHGLLKPLSRANMRAAAAQAFALPRQGEINRSPTEEG
jgi:hypothetical protein